jgi:AcrR family transcriptional regulator
MQHAYNERMTDQVTKSAQAGAADNARPGEQARSRPGTKRAEQRQQTEARILAAARQAFAEAGFGQATIRGIAALAGVNPGLIVHYFGTKEELFRRAASMTPEPPDAQSPEQLAEFLIGSLRVKLDGVPMASMAALRSMLTHPDAARDVQALIGAQIRQRAEAIPGQDAELRAALLGTTVLGVVIGRHLLRLDALRDIPADKIIELLRPCFLQLAGAASDGESADPPGGDRRARNAG